MRLCKCVCLYRCVYTCIYVSVCVYVCMFVCHHVMVSINTWFMYDPYMYGVSLTASPFVVASFRARQNICQFICNSDDIFTGQNLITEMYNKRFWPTMSVVCILMIFQYHVQIFIYAPSMKHWKRDFVKNKNGYIAFCTETFHMYTQFLNGPSRLHTNALVSILYRPHWLRYLCACDHSLHCVVGRQKLQSS